VRVSSAVIRRFRQGSWNNQPSEQAKPVIPGMALAIKALRGAAQGGNPKQVVSIRMSAAAVKRWQRLDREDRAKLVASLEKKKIEKRA
jgi:hypothetical protein